MKIHNKICEMCGHPFESKSAIKRFCNRPHYAVCCICGKEFLIPDNNVSYYFNKLDRVTCGSSQCKLKLSNQGKPEGYRRDAIRQSMISRYGVENPGQLKWVIEKRKQTSLARYGTEHPTQNSRVREKTKQTCREKYGVDYVTQSEQFKETSRQTCLDKHGVEYYVQTKEFKERSAQSMLERYGVEHALQSPEILENRHQTYLNTYGVDHPMQLPETQDKIRQTKESRYGDPNYSNPEKRKQTCLERYGTEHYLQSKDYQEKSRQSNLKKYGVDHHLKAAQVIEKRQLTCLQRYGSTNIFSSEFDMKKIRETMLRKYGVSNPSQHKPFKDKATRNARKSKLELRIFDLFINYGIEFKTHYFLQNKIEGISHEFDFYIPKYKLLIDADGLYFHAYLNDPNGKASIDYYDDIRMNLVPTDHIFYLIIEGSEDDQVKQIVKILSEIDEGIFNYDSYLFNWCRSIDFPYPNYAEKRLIGDWTSLCKYQNVKYAPQCRIGESIIKQYHRSIYSCHRGGSISPLEAWYDDDKLKAVIKNRLVYVNDVDPSKILRGFNVSKICPVVSIFNPILAKYLINRYLSEFSTIFDPFSGFSGRMLGAASLQKRYIGQDLNDIAVDESNQIISFLHLQSLCTVSQKDIFESSGEYECLLTCSPYREKEIYNQESEFRSCDEWIDECLTRFKCKRYVFIVDETSKYIQFVKEDIKSTSHFSDVTEKVIVIE